MTRQLLSDNQRLRAENDALRQQVADLQAQLQQLTRLGDGVLAHDGFASYDRFTGAIHQQCVAHVLRRARELLATATRGAVRFPRALIGLFTGAIHLHNECLRGRVAAGVLPEAREAFDARLLALLHPRRVVPA